MGEVDDEDATEEEGKAEEATETKEETPEAEDATSKDSESSEEKKDDTTTAEKDEEKPKKKKTISVEKEKKKVHKRKMTVKSYHVGSIRPYSEEIMAESKAKLDELARIDKERMMLEEIRNTYES